MQIHSIHSLNSLSPYNKRTILNRIIPPDVLAMFNLSPFYVDANGNDLLKIESSNNNNDIEISLFHEANFEDPILYAHMTDTANGFVHLLLYIMNDPTSKRYTIDKNPDGSSTEFGIQSRNIEEELKAMEAGLLPGQIRSGLRILFEANKAFEDFILSMGRDRYFIEPLYYHNACIFERYGFSYQTGYNKMRSIDERFSKGGDLLEKLGSNPFRSIKAKDHIRFRSWAIHDGILDEPFTNVTMYKRLGKVEPHTTLNPTVSW